MIPGSIPFLIVALAAGVALLIAFRRSLSFTPWGLWSPVHLAPLAQAVTGFTEERPSTPGALGIVEALSGSLAYAGENVREGIEKMDGLGDKDTADILTEISRGLDKWLWFVEAHVQSESGRTAEGRAARSAEARGGRRR